jgi:HrpA-like RNA helicase
VCVCMCVREREREREERDQRLICSTWPQAQAQQRTGRAGRMAAGKCFRLYQEEGYEELSQSAVPEIKRCRLSSMVLQLKVGTQRFACVCLCACMCACVLYISWRAETMKYVI